MSNRHVRAVAWGISVGVGIALAVASGPVAAQAADGAKPTQKAAAAKPAKLGKAAFDTAPCYDCHRPVQKLHATGNHKKLGCDTCHDAGWRTNCTFCHGGTDTESGAPPRDLQGSDDRAVQRFMPHTEHTTERNHAAWDCNQCHVKPVDVLTPGHIFDDRTPGAAEVDFSGGLSPGATWDGNGNCGNVYCHGNGVNPGNYNHAAARPNCDGCHSWIALGGRHLAHFGRLIGCVSCHNGTTDAAQMTADPVLHVNGTVDVIFETPDIAFNAGTCNGNCHGEQHNNRSW